MGYIAGRYRLVFVAVLSSALFTSVQNPTYAAPAALTRYVVPNGLVSGTCTAWGTACELQYALSVAAAGDAIWVKAGSYKPTNNTDRSISFRLKSGVAVYGGFSGTENALGQRNWMANATILSGDLGGGARSYHVTYDDQTVGATLDGFTITDGKADGSVTAEDAGGGMYSYQSNASLSNLVFINNVAVADGGALYNNFSNPRLTNVTFTGNAVPSGNGGAVLNDNSSPAFVNTTFSGNSVTGGNGGALYNDLTSTPALTNVTFYSNTAYMTSGFNGGHGGAVYNYSTDNYTMTNVTFRANRAVGFDVDHPAYGGAVYNLASQVKLVNTILWGNTPDQVYSESGYPVDYVGIRYSVIQGGCPTGAACQSIMPANPLLSALAYYGGSVPTILLLPGSPAIDAALDSACPATDARGVIRPQGTHCDIGATESNWRVKVSLPIATR